MNFVGEPKKRIGVIGTGFISKGFILSLVDCNDLKVSKVLTRREIKACKNFPKKDVLTNSLDDLIENSDIVVECSGDVIHATVTIDKILKAGKPVVTMNAEFHVTTGSYFVGKGIITEAEGDQPGSLAVLHENVVQMGFRPLVYGNVKGFYNPDPTVEDMLFWSKKQGLSLPMVTASTDGTKLQYEQALVANRFGATIVQDGMLGFRSEDIKKSAFELLKKAGKIKHSISDYVVNGKSSIRVFIVAEGDPRQKESLSHVRREVRENRRYDRIRQRRREETRRTRQGNTEVEKTINQQSISPDRHENGQASMPGLHQIHRTYSANTLKLRALPLDERD